MTFVNITALTYPSGAESEVEQRFAARKKAVDTFEGFLSFELLRPAFGEERYFVITRWESRKHFDAWMDARAAAGDDEKRAADSANSGMSVAPMGFDVVELAP